MDKGYGQLIRWHIIFCVFYYLVQDLLMDRSLDSLRELLAPHDLLLTLASFVILFVYAAVPYAILRKKYDRPWYVLAAWLLAGTLVAAGFRYIIEEVVAPVTIGFRNYPLGTSLLTYYLDNLYYLILHGAIGAVVFLLQTTQLREQQKQALIVENQRTELAFLRSQINPHFLFNTLNNVYSLFFQRSDKALRVIERLTVMLRYGLYEKAERVPLRKEVEHLVNFIELEKLRLDFEPDISLNLPDDDTLAEVPPLLLITFAENAFKHGDLRQPLSIDLRADATTLTYAVTNHYGDKRKPQDGGIGIENLRKRLSLLYGDRATMDASKSADTYRAHLQIPTS
ncbi:hypothetical protein FUA23_19590 [Neolewinella aurantiaca]|uniref:Signal transduction histidine kinase internal region domain-containing protein n=1 Tax=Neolewinella aurantiaca TaxID=2602767 RepID=A0A5C7FJ38_9BACT|nr:histidine kinase [Neolewinella aurantiaca]TXF86324.1 hypothetical protein FUA23_19590 [Neolewinella aurantiaca]